MLVVSRPYLVVAALALAIGAAQPASATVPADLCTGNPCTVSGNKTIDPGSVLDFGTADLVFASNAVVTVGAGGVVRSVQISAKSITFQASARLLGGGDSAFVMLDATGGDLRLQASGNVRSRIDVGGNQAGSILLSASGNVEIAGLLQARGTGTDSQGGTISAEANGAITVSADLDSGAGGAFSGGGEISFAAVGGVTIDGKLNTSAADFGGGPVSIISDSGNVSILKAIDVSGGGADGSAGSIDIVATAGSINIAGAITGKAGSGSDSACGDGAELSVFAGAGVTLAAAIDATGGTQCFGGDISIDAGLDFVMAPTGSIDARGPGIFGGGGAFSLGARNATLRAIDVTSPGFGGTVEVVATGVLDVAGAIDADAAGAEAIGGLIVLQACTINVAATGSLDTRGSFAFPGTGENRLRVGGLATVQGSMRATTANVIEHRGIPPVITGTVQPAATISVNPNLPDCVQIVVCGNGITDPGEACDDNNNQSCDGCSADCTREDNVCGDDTRECTEQCDDGNTDSGDGCESDCTLPASEGVLFPGLPLPTAGCMVEWKVAFADPVINPTTSLPKTTQTCTDGDPTCDTDATKNGVCTFGAQLCLRVPDSRLPNCNPASIDEINIRQPVPPGGSNPNDQNNVQQMITALSALGGEVRSGNNVLQSGPPIAGSNVCTQTMSLKVAHQPKGLGKRAFNISAQDTGGLNMTSNLVRLWCAPNTSVCGNDVEEVTEQCDDGNTQSCDGCNSQCKVEACGNGIIECNEICDDGPLNGTPGNRCSATCNELPPDLRIPGGGSKITDCAFEWSMELANPAADSKGNPKTQQDCKDNDPTCDFDPTVGNCRFRVWGCVGAADPRISCAATQVSRVDVKAPTAKAKRPEDIAARNALLNGFQSFTFPAGPGESCSNGFPIDVPASKRRLTLRSETRLSSGKKDIDALQLKCVP